MVRFFLAVVSLTVVALIALLIVAAGERGEPRPPLPGSATVSSSPPATGGAAIPTRRPAVSTTVGRGTAPVRPTSGEQAEVVRVVDGDTIDVRRADGSMARVRYIGVNTPETVDPRRPVECFGREASARNAELVAGKTVLLEKDVSETDQYGRLLRYVWVGDTFVNAVLVSEGYARPVTFPPDVRYADWYRAREQEARIAGRGLWSACRP